VDLRLSFLSSLKRTHVAVLGDGVSGRALQKLLRSSGIKFDVFDQRGEPFDPSKATRFSGVLYSPGFAPHHPWLKEAYKARIPCLNELDFASLFWPNRLIAVTGTNGKTSVTEWLACALRLSGRSALAVGNNGDPFSELVAGPTETDAVAVCEISSYQAASLRYLVPDSLLWTNFSPDHLSFHHGLGAYFRAKLRLLKRTLYSPKGSVYLGKSLKKMFPQLGCPVSPRMKFSAPADPHSSYPDEHLLFSAAQRENFQLIRLFWENEGHDPHVLERSLTAFQAPDHRLKSLATIRNGRFWNDSKGTNRDSLGKALRSFSSRPLIWIGGGSSKGENLDDYVHLLRRHPNIRAAFLLGTTGKPLEERLKPHLKCVYLETLPKVMEAISNEPLNEPVDVLFCPGFASLDQFRNYIERGQLFEKLVLGLKKKMESIERKV
jgi:UDP-N-acetylmuramoylalanine--D-glutamate ligase